MRGAVAVVGGVRAFAGWHAFCYVRRLTLLGPN